jgi:hypothetical protein
MRTSRSRISRKLEAYSVFSSAGGCPPEVALPPMYPATAPVTVVSTPPTYSIDSGESIKVNTSTVRANTMIKLAAKIIHFLCESSRSSGARTNSEASSLLYDGSRLRIISLAMGPFTSSGSSHNSLLRLCIFPFVFHPPLRRLPAYALLVEFPTPTVTIRTNKGKGRVNPRAAKYRLG